MMTEKNELKAMAKALNDLNRIMLNKALRDRFQLNELEDDLLVGNFHVLKKNLYITESYTNNFSASPQFTFQISLITQGKKIVALSSELPVPTNVKEILWNTDLVKTLYSSGESIAIDRILIEQFCLRQSMFIQ
jgi:hypothetical protein